jgi:hypothetical protein
MLLLPLLLLLTSTLVGPVCVTVAVHAVGPLAPLLLFIAEVAVAQGAMREQLTLPQEVAG